MSDPGDPAAKDPAAKDQWPQSQFPQSQQPLRGRQLRAARRGYRRAMAEGGVDARINMLSRPEQDPETGAWGPERRHG